jgi:hypothetical protein
MVRVWCVQLDTLSFPSDSPTHDGQDADMSEQSDCQLPPAIAAPHDHIPFSDEINPRVALQARS